jgi:tetratricopeptide (TPR) repeat protein
VDRAAAVARAEEQRKRFRLRLALTAAVLLVVAGAAAGGWWYDRVREARRAEQAAAAAEHDRRRDETRRDVIAALSQVDGLLAQTAGLAARPHQWEAAVASARAAAGQAEGVLNSGEPTDELRAAVAEADRTRKFVGRLATLIAGQTDRLGRRKPDAEYLAAFREAGLDPDRMPPAEFGEKVRRHPHAEILATALWDWGTSGGPERARYRYLSTAYVPLRKAFHLPKDLTREGAAAWADGLDPRTLSPARLALLALEAERLNRAAARRALEKAVDQYPDDYLLQTLLANRYFAEKPRRLGEAARHFAAAVALWPRSSSAWSNLGMVLTEQKDFPRAVAYLRHAIDLDPTNHLAYGNLGGALGDSGDKAGALDAYRKAVEFAQTDATAYYNLGVGLRENGEHDAALAAFRRAVVFDPRLAEAHHNIGIELKRRDDPEGAAAEFRAALEIEPDSLTSLSMLGNVLTILGDPEGARAALRRAVELYPDDADARATLGTANLYSGRFAEAIADLRAARKLPPGPDPQYNHERIDDSIGLAEELVRLEKRLPKVLSGEEKTDPEQLPMFVILCHNFKQMHAAAARLCDRWVKAKGLVNHDLSGIRVLATKAALKAGFGLGADPPPPAQRAEFLHMALRFAEAELFTWGLLAQLRADEFRDDAHKRFGAWLADRDLRVTRHWLGLVWFPPDDRAKWAAFWKRVAEQREKTAAKP